MPPAPTCLHPDPLFWRRVWNTLGTRCALLSGRTSSCPRWPTGSCSSAATRIHAATPPGRTPRRRRTARRGRASVACSRARRRPPARTRPASRSTQACQARHSSPRQCRAGQPPTHRSRRPSAPSRPPSHPPACGHRREIFPGGRGTTSRGLRLPGGEYRVGQGRRRTGMPVTCNLPK